MGCNKDSNCLTLANSVYPNMEKEINSASSSAISKLNSTIKQLQAVEVPDDYLGRKIKLLVDSVCSEIQNDINSIESATSGINSFINEHKAIHQKHYNEWKFSQNRRMKAGIRE